MKRIIIILIAIYSLNTFAQGNGNRDGVDFARSQESRMQNDAEAIDPYDIPGYQGDDVEAREYYDDGLGIEDTAQEEAQTDESAIYINNAYETRPSYELDRETDPLFAREEEIEQLSYSMTDSYTGCVNLPVGDEDLTDYYNETCSITGNVFEIENVCEIRQEAECTNGGINHQDNTQYRTVYAAARGRTWLTMQYNLGTGEWQQIAPSDGAAFHAQAQATSYDYYCVQNDTTVEYTSAVFWNEGRTHVGGSSIDRSVRRRVLQIPTCENDLTAIVQIQDRRSSSSTSAILSMGFNFTLNVTPRCDLAFSESNSCGQYQNLPLQSSSCTESGTRLISGFEVDHDCWVEQFTYIEEDVAFTEEPRCQELRDQGCGQTGASCLSFSGPFCTYEEIVFQCSDTYPARTVALCGPTLVCPDGNCTEDVGQTYEDATDDFQEAVTALAVADEIAQNFDPETLTIFSGDDMQCRQQQAGFSNCCTTEGWGQDTGLSECSTEEEILGLSREAERTVYVGSYTRGQFIDERTYRVFCVYPNKLSRIIIEQGKAYLGSSYGDAEDPVCDGFTMAEFEQIDFDQLDFSEYHEDVMERAAQSSQPADQETLQRTREAIGQ